jgi:tetratricopeptide (TPR) repeat protein
MQPETIALSLVALTLFGVSLLLLKKGPRGESKGGDAYVRRRKKRALGQLCIAGGIVSLGLGITTQVYRTNASAAPGPSGYSATAVPPQSSNERVTHPPAGAPATGDNNNRPNIAPETSLVPHLAPSDKGANPAAQVDSSATLAPASRPPTAATPALVPNEKPPQTLEQLNAYVIKHPESVAGYVARGNVYSTQKKFDLAQQDYKKAQEIDGNNSEVKFDLAENDFRQKNYDAARPGFVALQSDIILGDLAAYKVYLCDLFGGHEEQAAKELDAFNQVADNASYYFANIASCVYRGQKEEAKPWIFAAGKIYSRNKMLQYSYSLLDLGYLPLSHPAKSGEGQEPSPSK